MSLSATVKKNNNGINDNDRSKSDSDALVLEEHEYIKLKNLVFDQFGINLTEAKKGLILTRLQGVLKQYKFKTFSEYYDYVIHDKGGVAISELVNHISTNFTYFYREEKHFEFLKNTVLPEMTAMNKKKGEMDFRIWSAGCSSGEEPYTLMMVLFDFFGHDYINWKSGVLATDISENALNYAKNAIYPLERLAKLPSNYKSSYFKKLEGDSFLVDDKIRKEVTFRRFNLMNTTFPFKKQFHAIFCRNVMIYFDLPTRTNLINRFINHLVPGGYLFIGHSETLGRDQENLTYIQPAVYQKVP